MKKIPKVLITVTFLTLFSCAAKTLTPGAEKIELVNELPDRSKCEYLGEIVGTQGNWFTGDFTANEDLVVGARNELRNKAFELDGNIVYIQDLEHSSASESTGTTNVTGIGKVYKCVF
jgi:hypothetical protein